MSKKSLSESDICYRFIGTLKLYPLDGTDYENRMSTGKWEPLGSWHDQFWNEFNTIKLLNWLQNSDRSRGRTLDLKLGFDAGREIVGGLCR